MLIRTIAFLVVTFVGYAQTLPPGVERLATVEGVTEYRFANGLRALLFPDVSKSTITVNVTVLVGSKNENYGESGMAHLLEHLVFKGTDKHPDIDKEFRDRGARWNGTTWVDRTNYFETFPATEENLEWALDLEADRLVNSHIARKDLDSEMTVVRNEWEAGENNPNGVLLRRVTSTAFDWHNYGNATIGARSDIENVPIERLQAFYRTHYQPDNAVVTVAGKIEEARTVALIQKTFGRIPRPERKLPATYTQEPPQDGERAVTVRRVGDVQIAMAAFHVPSGAHADYPAVQVLSRVLGDSPSGRLHKALVEPGLAAGIQGFSFQWRDPGLALFGAVVRQDKPLEKAREVLLSTVQGVLVEPATAQEVERARNQILRQVELDLTNSDRIGLAFSEWISMGDWRLMYLHRDRIAGVTPEDVNRVAKAYLRESNRTVGLFIPSKAPERTEIPAPPEVSSLIKDYKGRTTLAEGEAFDPSYENIDRRSVRGTLAPGLKLVMVPKKTRGNTVQASLSLHFGDEESLKGRARAGSMAGAMLMRGTLKRSRQDIQDELDRLKARLQVGGGATGVSAFIETTKPSLEGTLQLLAEVLRQPGFPEKEFEQLRQQSLAGVEMSKSEPQQKAFTAMSRHLNPYPKGDVRHANTPEESIEELKALTLEDVKKFHQDFYGLARGELTLVGDFDPEQVQTLANKLFGGWKSAHAFTEVKNPYQKRPAVKEAFEAPDKANAVFTAALPLEVSDEDPDYPALILGNFMLGGDFNSRLTTRIRQKEGLSYGVSSSLFARSKQRSGQFMAFAICAPENVNKVEAAFRDEIAKMLKDGFTAEEVETAKAGWLKRDMVSRAQDAQLARRLGSLAFHERTMEWDAERMKKVQSLTPAQVLAAMKRHLDPAQISVFKAGDFKKAGIDPKQ